MYYGDYREFAVAYQQTCSGKTVKSLVTGCAEDIDPLQLHIKDSAGLCAVGNEADAVFAAELPYFLVWEKMTRDVGGNGAYHRSGVAAYEPAEAFKGTLAVGKDLRNGQRDLLFHGECDCRTGSGVVLHAADNDVTALGHYSLYRHIQRVGAVQCEHGVLGSCSEEVGSGLAGGIQRLGSPHGKLVTASACVSAEGLKFIIVSTSAPDRIADSVSREKPFCSFAAAVYQHRKAAALRGGLFAASYPARVAPCPQKALCLDRIGVGGHIKNANFQKYHPCLLRIAQWQYLRYSILYDKRGSSDISAVMLMLNEKNI